MTEREIFVALLDLPNTSARSAYLDKVCSDDSAMRTRIEALLKSHDAAGSFLGTPAVHSHEDKGQDTQTFAEIGQGRQSEDDESLEFLEAPGRPDSLGRIGHYEVLEILGRGGFGVVFRAFDAMLQRVVAVKVLSPQMAATSPARKRFLREARSSAKIRHENVVQVYAVEEQPLPYLVMEFIPGETLQQRLDRTGPLDVKETVHVGLQIAEGLAAAHGMGLIHRDIKPANIIIETSIHPTAKITDFGLARAADDASLTQSGTVAGTPLYMAPEQARGENLDHRADLFSFASVLYTMCSGRPPFRAKGTLAVLKRVAEDTPRSIQEIVPEVPTWLSNIIAKLHAKDPDDRFVSAAEVVDLLKRCQVEMQKPAKTANFPVIPLPTSSKKPAPKQAEPSAPPPPAPRTRRRWWVVAATVFLVLFGGLGLTEATGVTNLRGTVIRLFSPEGTLVVEVDDPGVSVKIEGSEMVITGAGPQQISLKPGKYAFEASKDGKVVSHKLIEIVRDGKEVVKVTLEPPQLVSEKQKPSWEETVAKMSPEEQVKAIGARMKELNSGFDGDLKAEYANGVVVKVDLNGKSVADISPLRVLTGLEWLRVSHTQVADLSALKNMKKLRELQCHNCPISDLTPLQGLPVLTILELFNSTGGKITNLTPLRGMPLSYLNLTGQPVSDLSALRFMPDLRRLVLENLPVSDLSLTPLKGLKVEEMAIKGTKFSDMEAIKTLPLWKLAMDDRPGREELYRSMKGLKEINHKPAEEFWKEVEAKTQLDRKAAEYVLSVGGVVKVNGKDVEIGAVGDLPAQDIELNLVNLDGKQVTDDGLANLKACKNLTFLNLDHTEVGDAGLAHLKNLKSLSYVNVGHTRIGEAGVANFKDCSMLEHLNLDGLQFGDAALAPLKDHKNLAILEIQGTLVGNGGLAHLTGCANLKELNANGSPVGDEGLADLKKCKNLTILSVANTLGNTEVTDKGLEHLKELKNLQSLNVSKCGGVTDAGLEHLKECKTLTGVQLKETKVTKEGIEKLSKALPKCRIEWDGGTIEP
jgi:serine/threonine protein kinase/Leucine-rich repeat (LRR) protein